MRQSYKHDGYQQGNVCWWTATRSAVGYHYGCTQTRQLASFAQSNVFSCVRVMLARKSAMPIVPTPERHSSPATVPHSRTDTSVFTPKHQCLHELHPMRSGCTVLCMLHMAVMPETAEARSKSTHGQHDRNSSNSTAATAPSVWLSS